MEQKIFLGKMVFEPSPLPVHLELLRLWSLLSISIPVYLSLLSYLSLEYLFHHASDSCFIFFTPGRRQIHRKNCWRPCGKKGGKCSWCGTNGFCCRKGWKDCPMKLRAVSLHSYHSCVDGKGTDSIMNLYNTNKGERSILDCLITYVFSRAENTDPF